MTRRKVGKLLIIILAAIAVLALVHVISLFTYDRKTQYNETAYYSEKIGNGGDGYVIALVADTHSLPREELEDIARNIDERGVDVLLLGGDFGGGYKDAIEVLGAVNTNDGVFGVEGNHDDYGKIAREMRGNGVVMLDNSGVQLGGNIFLAGVRDLWNWDDKPDADKAVAEAGEDDFVLLLCHNPDYSLDPGAGAADIVLSGHTHGGQATFLGLWAPALPGVTRYGHRFKSGWCEGQYGKNVFVSRGTGILNSVPRVFSPPEVVYITLHETE